MKKLCLKTLIFILLTLSVVSISYGQESGRPETIKMRVIVEKVGKDPKIKSGTRRLLYRLVKYQVLEVLDGKFDGQFIVVDHMIIEGDELSENLSKIKEGDVLILEVTPKEKLSVITRETGMRDEDEEVKIFYSIRRLKRIKAE